MDKKKIMRLIAVILIFFIAISVIGTLTAREKNSLNFLERVVRMVSYPFQMVFSQFSDKIQILTIDLNDLDDLREENLALRKEISQQGYEIDLLKKDKQENQRLRELLEYKELTKENFTLVVAKIIGRSTNNWQRSLFLNVGYQDGISENMVVINHQGLVGKIVNVSNTSSEVLLILDSDSGVGARLFETRQTIGIVQGMGIDQNNLSLVHMPKEMEIKEGDRVITSGLDNFYPAELNIGIVKEVLETQRGFTKTAVLSPVVAFDSLEEVFIITNYKKSLLTDEIEEEAAE